VSSLSLFTNVSLESTLSDISIATPACLGRGIKLVNVLLAFHPNAVFISVNKVGLL
jgi:hypothetical protein